MMRVTLISAVVLLACNGPIAKDATADIQKTSDKITKVYTEVYENGQVKIKGSMLDGERHGLWISFFENGVKWSEEHYCEGRKDGKSITYFPSGMFRYKGAYVDDERAGVWIFYNEEGSIEKEVDFSKK